MGKRQFFQEMMLEQLDIHLQKKKRIYTQAIHTSQNLTQNGLES